MNSQINTDEMDVGQLTDLINQLEKKVKTKKNQSWSLNVHEIEKSIKNCPVYHGESDDEEHMQKFSDLATALAKVFGIDYNKFYGFDDLNDKPSSSQSIESPMAFINDNMDKFDKVMTVSRSDVSITITEILSRFFIETGIEQDQKKRFYDTFQSLLSSNKIYERHDGMRSGTVKSYIPGYFIGKKIKWGKDSDEKPIVVIVGND